MARDHTDERETNRFLHQDAGLKEKRGERDEYMIDLYKYFLEKELVAGDIRGDDSIK